jgi:hypothetical protein
MDGPSSRTPSCPLKQLGKFFENPFKIPFLTSAENCAISLVLVGGVFVGGGTEAETGQRRKLLF